jgi:hypothetical protein
LEKGYDLQIYENKMFSKIFGPGKDDCKREQFRTLHDLAFRTAYIMAKCGELLLQGY